MTVQALVSEATSTSGDVVGDADAASMFKPELFRRMIGAGLFPPSMERREAEEAATTGSA